jgi:hypothetical protein
MRVDEDLLVVGRPAAAIPVAGRRRDLRGIFLVRLFGCGRRAAAAGAGRHRPASPRPGPAGVIRAVEPGFVHGDSRRRDRGGGRGPRAGGSTPAESAAPRGLRADQRIHARRVLGVDAEGDAPHVVFRKALRQLRPLLPRVGRLPDPALGAAADHLPHGTPALIRGRVDDVGVPRIEHDVADSRVVAHVQHALPFQAAVSRLVEAALAAGGP